MSISNRTCFSRTLLCTVVGLLFLNTINLRSSVLISPGADCSNGVPVTLIPGGANNSSNSASDLANDVVVRPPYQPGPIEEYLIQNADSLGYNTQKRELAKGCTIWKNNPETPIHKNLMTLLDHVKEYNQRVQKFPGTTDVRLEPDHEVACRKVDMLEGLTQELSLSSISAGYVEPLYPPMRHPQFCWDDELYLLNLDYLIHDFGAMCRSLKPTSRTVFIDMGASLLYHADRSRDTLPAVFITEEFRKFGMPFDHIYAFEVTPIDAKEAFSKIPKDLMSAYHWINVGVNPEPDHPLNPLTMILNNFNEDDLIIVKLDIDTPKIEMELVKQILKDERLWKRIDQFYFEHHVHLDEIYHKWWGKGGGYRVQGSVKYSMELFHELRTKGIAAHFWV